MAYVWNHFDDSRIGYSRTRGYFFRYGSLFSVRCRVFRTRRRLDAKHNSLVCLFTRTDYFTQGRFPKLAPGEEEVGDVDEDKDAIGTVVEVVETVLTDSTKGRIKFRGTTWEAVSKTTKIEVGRKAKLVERRDLVWYVIPIHD